MRLNSMRGRLGMLEVGNTSDGSALYLAEEDEDTSGFYPVGADAYGNTLYSTNPGTSVDSGLANQIANIVGSVTAIYQAKTLTDINADRMRQGMQPLSATQTASLSPHVNVGIAPQTQQLLIYGAIALVAYMMISKAR